MNEQQLRKRYVGQRKLVRAPRSSKLKHTSVYANESANERVERFDSDLDVAAVLKHSCGYMRYDDAVVVVARDASDAARCVQLQFHTHTCANANVSVDRRID